ncbi:hypothetical protein HanPI659440_Chr04g0162691 [Helianthus annuus]|nr:hypothetical protein HanPI659440_Chr04g0162691 [Helianthus annuus]
MKVLISFTAIRAYVTLSKSHVLVYPLIINPNPSDKFLLTQNMNLTESNG